MSRKYLRMIGTTLAATCALAITGCPRESPPPKGLVSDVQIKLDTFTADLDVRHDPSQCSAPRPENIGCTTLCKPCIVWVCQDGQWERLDLSTMDDEICEPIDRPDAPDPFACPRDENGFCPAECSFCY